MILIDNDKTIISGEAVKVLAEIAAVLDRLILELADKRGGPTYEEIQEKFTKLMDIVVDIRGSRKDINPEEIIKDNKIQRLFKEEFFNLINRQLEPRRDRSSSSRSSESNLGDAEDMLERAMRKLDEAKKQDSVPKKKKKSKKSKKKIKNKKKDN